MKQKRNLIIICALAAVFLFGQGKTTLYAQTPNSIPQAQTTDDAARRVQLVEALERAQEEVKASRLYIDGLETSIKSKQAVIDAEGQRQTLSDAAIASLQKEVEDLKSVVSAQEKTLETSTAEVDYLKKELGFTQKKLHRSRTLNKYLILTAAALIAARLLIK